MMKPHLKEVPGPSGIELIKMVWEFRRNPITALQKSSQKYGDIVAFRFGVETIYLLFHPDHIKHIFIDHYYYYSKQNALWVRLSPFLGQGLLTSEGDFWKKQRKLIQPTFHREHIAKLAESMQEPAQMMARQWQKKSDQSINVWIEMMRLTLQILGKTLLHVDFSEQASMIRQYIDEIVSHVNWQSKRIFLLPTKVPTLRNRRFLKALQSFDKIIYQMITSRRKLSQQPFDLLGLLLGIEDEKTREEMSNKQIRDELITFIFAGHETTANALAWAWYLIARHPDVQEKIHQELNVVLAGKTPGLAKLAQLTYLDAVLKESMRLYPPVWFLGRKVVQENQINVVISDVRMPEGNGVELLERINEMPESSRPLIFFITGQADISKEEALERGVQDYFPKPFNLIELMSRVEDVIQQKLLK